MGREARLGRENTAFFYICDLLPILKSRIVNSASHNVCLSICPQVIKIFVPQFTTLKPKIND